MKKLFPLVILVVLAACAPAVTTPVQTDVQAGANVPQSSPTPPNEEPSISSVTALPILPLPATEEVAFTIAGQMGGTINAAAFDGNIVYLGVGPRLLTVDITDLAAPRLLWQSEILSGMVGAIAIQAGLAYVGAGREFHIYNVIDPANPVRVSSLSAFNESEQISWLEIFLADQIAYTVSFVYSSQRLVAFEVNDSTQPTLVATRELSQGAGITVSGNVLYIADQGRLQLVDAANLDHIFSEVELSDAWSYRVSVQGDAAYVVENPPDNNPDSLRIFNVSNPAQPHEITIRPMDILHATSWTATDQESLFLLAQSWSHEGCPLLYVIDITDPASPSEPVEYDPQSCVGRVALAGDTLLAISSNELQVFNISDPVNIRLAGKFSPPTGFTDVQGITLNQGLAYIHSTAPGPRLRVLDMTGSSPVPLSVEVTDMGPHYDIGFQGLYVRGNILFMQIQASMIGFDISEAANPRLITNEVLSIDNWAPPGHVGNILYKTATDGIEIVDISDPGNPIVAKTVPLEGFMPQSLYLTEGRLIVFSQNVENPEEGRRLQIFDISNSLEPVEVGRFRPAFDLWAFTVADNMIYTAVSEGEQHSLHLIDISDPAHPAEAGRFALPKTAGGLISRGDILYMMMTDMYNNEIWALNVSDRSHPYLAGHHPLLYLAGWHYPLPASDFAMQGDQIYLAAGNLGLYIVQVEK